MLDIHGQKAVVLHRRTCQSRQGVVRRETLASFWWAIRKQQMGPAKSVPRARNEFLKSINVLCSFSSADLVLAHHCRSLACTSGMQLEEAAVLILATVGFLFLLSAGSVASVVSLKHL